MKNILISLYFIFCHSVIIGQDLHYTNYDLSKHYFNPSMVGSFQGTIRVGGIYREQFRTFINKPYSSALFFIESPISYGIKSNHWVGAGIIAYQDRAGDLALQNSGMIGAVSYHIGLDKKFKNVFSIGFQYGTIARRINPKNALFRDQFVKGTNVDLGLITDYKENYTDYSIGTKFNRKLSTYSDFNFGIAMFHLAQPSIRFKNGTFDNTIHRRYNINASYGIDASQKISFTPAIYFSKYTNIYNSMVQVLMNYRIFDFSKKENSNNKNNVLDLQFGVGYRLKDAIQFLVVGNYNNWQVGASYDLTISSASAYNDFYGGFEIGVNKILNFPGKPKIDSKFYCPRF
ncbi:MAG: PorP/SprF family type IX secretion system membrane protein [Saprospiraceae bacterium]|nr:PorP/SprF family type IX secretion system membrane protein [Saprospiraceae bacterium]